MHRKSECDCTPSCVEWRKRHYPESAKSAARRAKRPDGTYNDAILLRHCIRKWRGVERHQDYGTRLALDGTASCALCVAYYDHADRCKRCPLFDLLGRRCDDDSDGDYSPWGALTFTDNPKPMREALAKALALEKEKE